LQANAAKTCTFFDGKAHAYVSSFVIEVVVLLSFESALELVVVVEVEVEVETGVVVVVDSVDVDDVFDCVCLDVAVVVVDSVDVCFVFFLVLLASPALARLVMFFFLLIRKTCTASGIVRLNTGMFQLGGSLTYYGAHGPA
jgi:hypothetical protein